MNFFTTVGEATAAIALPTQVEQPPYPCAQPLTIVRFTKPTPATTARNGHDPILAEADADKIEAMLDRTYAAVKDLLRPSPLQLQDLPSAKEHRQKQMAIKNTHNNNKSNSKSHTDSAHTQAQSLYTWCGLNFRDPQERVNFQTLYQSGKVNGVEGRKESTPMTKNAFGERNAMLLEGLPRIGSYHLTRATMLLDQVTPQEFLTEVHCIEKGRRQRFTPGMKNYVRWLTNPRLLPATSSHDPIEKAAPLQNDEEENHRLRELAAAKAKVLSEDNSSNNNSSHGNPISALRHWYIESNIFAAPPPVSCREAIMAVEKLYCPEEDCFYIYGCSVDCPEHPAGVMSRAKKQSTSPEDAPHSAHDVSEFTRCVKATYLFGWRLAYDPAQHATRATMVSIMHPGGWTPAFLLSLFKSEVGKEVCFMRRTLYEMVMRNHRDRPSRATARAAANLSVLLERGEDGKMACRTNPDCSCTTGLEKSSRSSGNCGYTITSSRCEDRNDTATGCQREYDTLLPPTKARPCESDVHSASDDTCSEADRLEEWEAQDLQVEDERVAAGLDEEELVWIFS